jgi:hypothetical protein
MLESKLDAALKSSSDDDEAPVSAQRNLFQVGIFNASDDPVGYSRSEQRQWADVRKRTWRRMRSWQR